MTTATPIKLNNGSWGAKVSGAVQAGEEIKITTKGGKSWLAVVAKVVWSGENVAIVATQKSGHKSGGYTPAIRNSRGYVSQRGHYEDYCGYPCPVTGLKCCPENGPCHDCR